MVREQTGNRSLVLFDRGDEVTVQAGEEGIRFLLVSGKPIEEPVAWYGPIVMNTQAELQQAVAELRSGTFIRASSGEARQIWEGTWLRLHSTIGTGSAISIPSRVIMHFHAIASTPRARARSNAAPYFGSMSRASAKRVAEPICTR